MPFAPAAAYGSPDELKSLIDTAHGLGVMVFLDVVYNHFGPEGNYLPSYASAFFHDAATPWGAAIAVATPAVGDYFLHNALYWIEEFQVDGLRFDAVHALDDPVWLRTLAARVRGAIDPQRHVHLILENERNQASLLGSPLFDAQWNDDFHNALHALLTGEDEGYYAHYQPPMGHLVRALAEGFAYQGERMGGRSRGEPSGDLSPMRFVNFLQNHDQIGNRAFGDRLTALVAPEVVESALVLLLLAPPVPLLFMGEECASRTPFLFFAHFANEPLRSAVTKGRRKEFEAFAGFGGKDIPDPNDLASFHASIPVSDPEHAARRETLVGRLIALRREHAVAYLPSASCVAVMPLGPRALRASWSLGVASLSIWVNFSAADVSIDRPPLASSTCLHGDQNDMHSARARCMRIARWLGWNRLDLMQRRTSQSSGFPGPGGAPRGGG